MKWNCTSRIRRERKKLSSDELKALDKALEKAQQIIEEAKDINDFRNHPKVKKIKGSEEEYYRIAVSRRWRVICKVIVEENIVIVSDVGPRNDSEVYKAFRRRIER